MNKARILFYDIETSPNISYTWGKWEQNVIAFKKEWELLSFAYKWEGSNQVHCLNRTAFKDKTDRSLTKALWMLFNEADILVAHNGKQFDDKKARAKFIEHGLQPPAPSKSIDTKQIAKSQFMFNSNSLDDLGQLLGLGRKVSTGGFDLWLGCMKGDKKSWAKMSKYNKQDVILLEKVYLKLRAWHTTHPNLSAYLDREGCPACSSQNTQRRGTAVAAKKKRQRHQCQDCGHWFTGIIKG